MAKEEPISVTGIIKECLPGATFKVLLENDMVILGIVSGKIRKNKIKILQGDKVDLEMTPYDLSKGRIVFRHK